jgi:hypothetical protein
VLVSANDAGVNHLDDAVARAGLVYRHVQRPKCHPAPRLQPPEPFRANPQLSHRHAPYSGAGILTANAITVMVQTLGLAKRH